MDSESDEPYEPHPSPPSNLNKIRIYALPPAILLLGAVAVYGAATANAPDRFAFSPGWTGLALALGFFGSALFTILHQAFFALDAEDLESLDRENPAGIRALRRLRQDMESTWLLLLTGAFCANLVFAFAVAGLLWGSWGRVSPLSFWVALVLASLAVFLLGEVLPGLIAARWKRSLASPAAQLTRLFSFFFFPLAFLPISLLKLASQALGISREASSKTVEVEQRLLALIGLGQVDVSFEEEEKEMIDHALEFGRKTAEDLMTPRKEVTAVSVETSQEEALALLRETNCSRLLVFDKTMDHIAGVIHAKQILLNPETPFSELMTVPIFVPLESDILDLLNLMREKRSQIVVVLDDYGTTKGIVTMNDILEALVGPLPEEEESREVER